MRAWMASVALTASPAARRSDSCTAFQEVQTGAALYLLDRLNAAANSTVKWNNLYSVLGQQSLQH